MKIQVNSDASIHASEGLAERVGAAIEQALDRFSHQVTRVEVHLSDENSGKSGPNDQRCMIEARLQGRPPVAVTDQAESLDLAVQNAADKLARLLDTTLGRLHDQRTRGPDAPLPGGGLPGD
jgi:ribosome-associated translation inhibitor RaiA